jgi:hypothetical protein
MEDVGHLRRIPIHPLPFRVGRQEGVELRLCDMSVSKLHAEIYRSESALRLRDMGSKHGTFVNLTRVEDASIEDGDIIRFAGKEFRIGWRARPDDWGSSAASPNPSARDARGSG